MTPRVLRLLPFSCLRFVAWAFRGRGLWTFLGDAHYSGPQHALPNHITWLNHPSDRPSRDVRAAHLEYCLVEIRIEFCAQRIETLNAVPFQDIVKFALNEFDPLMQGFGGALDHGSGLTVRFQCPAQVVGPPRCGRERGSRHHMHRRPPLPGRCGGARFPSLPSRAGPCPCISLLPFTAPWRLGAP